MDRQVKIVIADKDENSRRLIQAAVREMGYEVFETDDGLKVLEICRTEKIRLIISGLFIKNVTIVDMVRNIQKLRPNVETIVVSDIFMTGMAELMRRIGVLRILKKPLDIISLKDAIESGLVSQRLLRLAVQRQLGGGYNQERIKLLLAHEDNTVFKEVLKLCLENKIEIECAKTFEHMIEKLGYSCYDVLVVSPDFADKIVRKSPHAKTQFGFILCVVAGKDVPAHLGLKIGYSSYFPFSFTIKMPIERSGFLKQLHAVLPKYRRMLNKYSKEGFKKRIANHLKVFKHAFGLRLFGFYLLLIVLVGLLGYFVGYDFFDHKEVQTQTKALEIDKIIEMQKLLMEQNETLNRHIPKR
jgi:CheY-like chemotaxis protein